VKTSKQTVREAKQIFRVCLVDGRIDEDRVRMAVRKVLRGRRRGYLTMLRHFLRLLKLESERHAAKIESALPLSTDLKARVQMGLENTYGPGLTALFTENPLLIGGIRIKVASDLYDNNVRSVLATLATSFGITNSH
jgi:F-type H+-transporting ATPase subunit delta